ncbi:hypothetical protein B0H14DRAFT_2723182 [Mycena olivaceomarginata]|nr:hypothetical protein B0H14DRAFT_2723182 [Mycena olivaceomarginata]
MRTPAATRYSSRSRCRRMYTGARVPRATGDLGSTTGARADVHAPPALRAIPLARARRACTVGPGLAPRSTGTAPAHSLWDQERGLSERAPVGAWLESGDEGTGARPPTSTAAGDELRRRGSAERGAGEIARRVGQPRCASRIGRWGQSWSRRRGLEWGRRRQR